MKKNNHHLIRQVNSIISSSITKVALTSVYQNVVHRFVLVKVRRKGSFLNSFLNSTGLFLILEA